VAGVNWRLEYRTLTPPSNYTVTAYIESALYPVSDGYASLVLRNGTSGSFVVFGHAASSTGFALAAVKYSSPTVGIATYTSQTLALLPGGLPKWLRIHDDGTNRIMEHSYNGLDWTLHYSIGRTDFVTPDQIGWGAHSSGGQTNLARLRSFSVV
jgi:hypothetical protein